MASELVRSTANTIDEHLRGGGRHTVNDLMAHFDITRPTTYRALNYLIGRDVINKMALGNNGYYFHAEHNQKHEIFIVQERARMIREKRARSNEAQRVKRNEQKHESRLINNYTLV